MRPSKRRLTKWRKGSPKKHRSYAEKRGRKFKHVKKEMEKYRR